MSDENKIELSKQLALSTSKIKSKKMKNTTLKFRTFHVVLLIFLVLPSMGLNASFNTFKSNLLEKQKRLGSFSIVNEQTFDMYADIYSSYRYALELFHKGNPEAAINELNANCIPYIAANNSFIYKAYKLLITCYKGIDKDGSAQDKLTALCAAVGRDKSAVQQTLDNTSL
jgi:hypothetical protein